MTNANKRCEKVDCPGIKIGVSKNRGTPKWMVCNSTTLLKWMIWGYHYFWKHPNQPSVFFKFMTVKKCGGPVDPTLNGVRGSWNQDSGHLGHPNSQGQSCELQVCWHIYVDAAISLEIHDTYTRYVCMYVHLCR